MEFSSLLKICFLELNMTFLLMRCRVVLAWSVWSCRPPWFSIQPLFNSTARINYKILSGWRRIYWVL